MKRDIFYLSIFCLAVFLFCQASFASSDKEEKRSCVFEKDGAACHRLGMIRKEADPVIAKNWFKLGCKRGYSESCEEFNKMDILISKQKSVFTDQSSLSNDVNIDGERVRNVMVSIFQDMAVNNGSAKISQSVKDKIKLLSAEEKLVISNFFEPVVLEGKDLDIRESYYDYAESEKKYIREEENKRNARLADQLELIEKVEKRLESMRDKFSPERIREEEALIAKKRMYYMSEKKRLEGISSDEKKMFNDKVINKADKNIQERENELKYLSLLLDELK